MKISYNWLQDYFEKPLPTPEKIGEALTMHAFEIESIEKVGSDSVLDIKVLPDRSHDCLSHRGIALEVSLLLNLPIKPEIRILDAISAPESNLLKVNVEDPRLCRRFSALMIEHVEVKDSPTWLKERLEAIGQRSINNIVDATNYVMFALGQPLHAYDRELLNHSDGEWNIVVRKAIDGENLLALDNKEYTLLSTQVAIVDGASNSVLGIAGVKGGKASEITKQTKHIILEAANFDPVVVRKTAKTLGLRTDASVRFENEITPDLTLAALKMVSGLIFDIAKTDHIQVEGLVDVYPVTAPLYRVGVSLREIQNLLGITISQSDVEKILGSAHYHFDVVKNPRETFLKTALSLAGTKYQMGASVLRDSPRMFDCSGLVAYCAMISGIMTPRISVDQYVFCDSIEQDEVQSGDLIFALTPGGTKHTETKEWLSGTPVSEGIDHVGIMISKTEVFHTSVHNPDGARVESLEDFLSIRELRGFRRIPSIDGGERMLVTIPAERLDLRMKEDLIEEIGRIYGYQDLKAVPINSLPQAPEIEMGNYYTNTLRNFFVDLGFSEVITYVFRNSGEVELQNPLAGDKAFLRKNLTDGLGEALLLNNRNKDLLGVKEIKIFEIGNVFTKEGEYTSFAFTGTDTSGIADRLENLLGVKLTFVTTGNIHEAKLVFDSKKPIESISAYNKVDTIRFKPFSSYPCMLRDIAVFVPEGDDKDEIIRVVEKEAGGLLVQSQNFDSFTKEFPEGKKTSYAYHLVFQSMEKTLTDEEINEVMNRVTEILHSKSGWQVR